MISYIALHHGGGIGQDAYAPSQHLTWKNIDDAHKARWNFISSLGYYGGYNFYVEKDGSFKQFRKIGEETAAQYGYNFNTISFCLAGNFVSKDGKPVESPTDEQKSTLKKLLKQIMAKDYTGIEVAPGTQIDVNKESIHPHRYYQNTQCNCLPDNWGKDLLAENIDYSLIEVTIDSIISLLNKLKLQLRSGVRLGEIERSCEGFIRL